MADRSRSIPAICRELGGIPSSTLYHYLHADGSLKLRSWRRQKQVFYAADYEGTRKLLTFLTRECCQGHPEICGDLARLAALPELEEA